MWWFLGGGDLEMSEGKYQVESINQLVELVKRRKRRWRMICVSRLVT